MAVDLNEIKINIRSLLTSSQKPLSILQLQKDYREQEGCNLPYKSLGFSSVIELLQNIRDVVTVPPNPNESSTLSLVVGEKTNHLRMLVVKQKTNTKKKKSKSNTNNRIVFQSRNRNNNFSGCNSNNRMPMKTNNYTNNKSQNTKNYYHRHYNSSISSNQFNQSSSSSTKSYSDLNRNNFSQNDNSSSGYVTDKLRSDLERYIIENKMVITEDKLKETVKKHPDYLVMKVNNMQDLKDRVGGFLNINNASVSLKNTPVIHHNTVYECNDQKVLAELITQLKNNEFKEDTPHTKYQNDGNYGMNSKIDKSIESSTEYINMCKNESMVRTIQGGFINTDKNSDIAKTNLRKNFENQSKIRKNKAVGTLNVNEKKPQSYSITMSSDNSLNTSNSFLNSSTPKKNNNDKITLDRNQCIPAVLRLNIAKIFKTYYNGVNIENFKFIYAKLYHTILDPMKFGFKSINEMLKSLDQIIEVRNNVFYTKNEFKLYANVDSLDENTCLMKNICLNDENISASIEQPILSFNQDKIKMLLVETYNPSLFYLQLKYKVVELDRLMIQMQNVYENKNKNNLVEPKQVLPGLFYATSYTSFLNLKQWYRVRVLREVNSSTVEVIHVDYGTVDNIPKTELRFLNYKFCSLPCQAIHCCLTGYNELDSIAPEVTKAFLKVINNNKEVLVMVDDHFTLSLHCQILHVTLFQYKSNDSKKLENINNELTIWHLNR